MQVQTHHGNVESTSSCVQGSASGNRQGYRGPLGGVCGGTRDTPPTPRHEGFVQTPENDGGPGRGGKPRDSRPSKTRTAICCEIRGISSGGGRGSSAICSTPSLPHSNHPSSRRYSSGGRHRSCRRPGQGRKSRSQYHSRQSQRTRRRRRQSGRWQTGKRRALTHSQ